MHGKPNHQLVRCAALYMLYSLYFKQPCRCKVLLKNISLIGVLHRPRAKIRLVASELSELEGLVSLARKEAHWDVLYAWCKLLTEHAFHYTACVSQMGLEVAQQMEARETAEKSVSGGRDEYFKSKEYSMLMKKLGRAHAKYTSMKNSLVDCKTPGEQSLFLADPVFPSSLKKLLRSKQDKKKEDDSGAIGRKRRALKDRAFGDIPGAGGMEQSRDSEMEDDEDWKLPSSGVGRGRGRGRGRSRGRGGSPSKRGRKRVLCKGNDGGEEAIAIRQKRGRKKLDHQGEAVKKAAPFPRRVPKSKQRHKED